jgi:predicted  nucleic acid-binding Zn-ribbon protein
MESNSNQGIFKIATGVLIGVVALISYLFIGARDETFELQKALTTKVEELSSTQIKLDSISRALDNKIVEIQQLGGNVKELQAVKAQLEADKKRLKSDFNFSIEKYDVKIKEYENFLVVKDDDIRKLKEDNGTLLARTKTLEEEKQQVITENTGLKTEKESLKTEKEGLTQTVVSYTAQNDELKRKVTLATAMKAVNVQVAALARNGKIREGGLYKSSKIENLKISFIMPSNPVAEKNSKDIFVRIFDKDGAVVSEDAKAGTLQFDGKEIGYSVKQSVPFENNDQKVEITYAKGSVYKAGKYNVELYSEGFKIGSGAFEVK